MASASIKGRRPFRCRRAAWLPALAIFTLMSACSRDSYEPRMAIEGMYQPSCEGARPETCLSGCIRIEGRRAAIFAPLSSAIVAACQPTRVSELGTLTLASGFQSEAGRLEFADSAVYVQTELLKRHGRFEYSERSPTPNDWMRHNPFTTGILVLIGLGVAVSIPLGLSARESKRRRERERLKAEVAREEAARAAAAAREKAARAAAAAARAATLTHLQRLISEAERAAASLPIILGEAELTLDRADEELQSQLALSFWEAMEEAVEKLQAFQGAMWIIEARRVEYSAQASTLDGAVPGFRLGVSVLPDPTGTQNRLTHLYRQAQAIPHFCVVYEQRRTTSTLVAGFRSLGHAVERLGHRIVVEIGSLSTSLGSHLDSLEKSLESSAAAAAEQSAVLRTQLQSAVGSNDTLSRQLHQDAEAHSETERLALRMLDNIQHRRKPSIFDRP